MNNNNVRQISDEEIKQELTKEQLQQTQVLNFQEVQKAIRFEKITSKKPAILVAVLGIISIIFGSSIQIATTLKANNNSIQKRTTTVNNIEVEKTKLNCVKTTINNPEGINTIYNVNYSFDDNKLVGVTKTYDVSTDINKESAKKQIENYINEYKALLNDSDGYKIDLSHTNNTTLTLKVVIDYKKFDMTKLKEIQQTKPFTKVDYMKNTEYSKIRSEMLESGFTVE